MNKTLWGRLSACGCLSGRLLALFAICGVAVAAASGPFDLSGKPIDPFQGKARARVFLFVRSDCPISNQYAPELRRISKEFTSRGVQFWVVYADKAATKASITKNMKAYGFPGQAIHDPNQVLVKRAKATVSPEAAVFNAAGKEVYRGRIDNLYVNIGLERHAATTHDLEAAVSAVLAGRPVKQPVTKAVGCWLADLD